MNKDVVEYICDILFVEYIERYDPWSCVWKGLLDIMHFGFTSKNMWRICNAKMNRLCRENLTNERFTQKLVKGYQLIHYYRVYPDWRCVILFKNGFFYSQELKNVQRKLGATNADMREFDIRGVSDQCIYTRMLKGRCESKDITALLIRLNFDQTRFDRLIQSHMISNKHRYRYNKRRRLVQRVNLNYKRIIPSKLL